MKAFVVMVTLAFVVLANVVTPAYAHKLKQVRRELNSQGYEQIEFERTKFPVWVNACRGGQRYHLHVDWYGKIKKKTRTGSCTTDAEYTDETATKPIGEPQTTKTGVNTQNSSISPASMETDETVEESAVEIETEPTDESKSSNTLDCKKFFPAIGKSITVPCD